MPLFRRAFGAQKKIRLPRDTITVPIPGETRRILVPVFPGGFLPDRNAFRPVRRVRRTAVCSRFRCERSLSLSRGFPVFIGRRARLSDTRQVVPREPPTDFIVFPPSHSSRLVSASRLPLPGSRSLIIIRLLAGLSLCSSAAHRFLLRTQSAFLRARARVIRVWVINYTGVNWLLRDDHRKQPITSNSPRLFPRLPCNSSPPAAAPTLAPWEKVAEKSFGKLIIPSEARASSSRNYVLSDRIANNRN